MNKYIDSISYTFSEGINFDFSNLNPNLTCENKCFLLASWNTKDKITKLIIIGGRLERTMCLILACIFGPSVQSEEEKKLFNALLKRQFDFEPSNFIEELLSNLIKEQLIQFGLKHDPKQIQRVNKAQHLPIDLN